MLFPVLANHEIRHMIKLNIKVESVNVFIRSFVQKDLQPVIQHNARMAAKFYTIVSLF